MRRLIVCFALACSVSAASAAKMPLTAWSNVDAFVVKQMMGPGVNWCVNQLLPFYMLAAPSVFYEIDKKNRTVTFEIPEADVKAICEPSGMRSFEKGKEEFRKYL